ncbi:MAG: VOC family protein [Bacteroidales bacterium]|nr:VOC family protein [Bacteroidales bacterium]
MKEKVICGLQQVGVGVKDANESWKWYRRHFGIDIPVVADEGVAERMLPYTGGKPQPRFAILAVNLQGGGGLEIWEPRGRELNYPPRQPMLGDLGIFIAKIKSRDVAATYGRFKAEGLRLLSEPCKSFAGLDHFYMSDPWDNILEIEQDGFIFAESRDFTTGGTGGAVLGVSDMDRSIAFYGKVLGFDEVRVDKTAVFEDLKGLPGGDRMVRRVMLERTRPFEGPLSGLMGPSHIELVQAIGVPVVKLYENRYWGDPGYIQICFDVRNMEAVERDCRAAGHPFVCDSGVDFDMGDANGHFTYIEDPDGTLIEFVETFRIPVMKKWGIYLDFRKRDDHKPLPRWMLKALRFLRVSDVG